MQWRYSSSTLCKFIIQHHLHSTFEAQLSTFSAVKFRYGHFIDVRLAAFKALISLDNWETHALTEYIHQVGKSDPSLFVRRQLIRAITNVDRGPSYWELVRYIQYYFEYAPFRACIYDNIWILSI